MITTDPDGGDPTKGSPALPSRRKNPNVTFAGDDGKIDLLARMLRQGDPLADAVVAELRVVGAKGRNLLEAGLRDGLATLKDVPPAIEALLQQLETIPEWVEPGILQRPLVAYLSIEPRWMTHIALSFASLFHTYSSTAQARVLVGTGRLALGAGHRLGETGVWLTKVILPGGLVRGEQGYVATAQVRLLHALRRMTTLRRGWDVEAWGLPISQVDLARTWLDFTLVPFRALAQLGFDFTEAELRDLYALWRYVGYLLGIDPIFYRDVHDHDQAEELLDLLEMTDEPPDENSRALIAATMEFTVATLMHALHTPPALARDLGHALARYIQGDERADVLGIDRPEVLHLMPLIVHDNQATRRLHRLEPGAWERMLEQNLAAYRAELAALTGPTEFQTFLSAGHRPEASQLGAVTGQ
jgi:hypothetical protein